MDVSAVCCIVLSDNLVELVAVVVLNDKWQTVTLWCNRSYWELICLQVSCLENWKDWNLNGRRLADVLNLSQCSYLYYNVSLSCWIGSIVSVQNVDYWCCCWRGLEMTSDGAVVEPNRKGCHSRSVWSVTLCGFIWLSSTNVLVMSD